MKEIILITTSFPYSVGEQFLDVEVSYYKNHKEAIKFKILPTHKDDNKRVVDDFIKIDDYLIEYACKRKGYKLLYFLIKSMFDKIFYKEFFLHNLLNIKKFKIFIASIVKYQLYQNALNRYFKESNDASKIILYTYWNTEITYALQSLKKKYNYKLISRIHGTDIYQERRICGYMPLKKQFTKNIDKIYTITESASDYLHQTYGFDYEVLELSRLGVEDKNIISKPSKKNVLHIVSCSSLIEVKRVDKIINALSIIAKQMPNKNYIWTHIGSGGLSSSLEKMANEKLGKLKNVKFSFMGHLENKEVFEFYKNNYIDLFINVSQSEGAPVSIMEAMSCHIPIVAPDVGGVSDMVIDKKNGCLLSSVCKIDEIVNVLRDENFYKNKEIRNKSYILFLEKYDAKKNYRFFLNKLIEKKTYED